MGLLINGQVGWRSATIINPSQGSTLWDSIYAVWNADALGTSLDTNIYRVYNGDDVNDSSGNAQHGTNAGGVTFTTGKVGNAFTFNGSNYVQLPNDTLNSLTGDFSISFWVYYTSLVGGQGIICNNTYNGTNSWGIGILTNGNGLFFRISNGTSTNYDLAIASGQAMYQNTWYHYTITRKASTGSKIYRNGVLLVSDTNTVNPVYNSGNIRPAIGAWSYGPLYSNLVQYYMSNNSKIDGLTIWNKELTASEITSLYNSGNGAEYPFSTQTLPTSNDSYGTNHGTLMNGATFTTGKIGSAFTFDGINDYIQLPDVFKFTTDFSFSAWIKTNASGNYIVFNNYYYKNSLNHGYSINVRGNDLYFQIMNGATIINLIYTNPSGWSSQYNHISIVRKANTSSNIYVNGVRVVFDTNTTNPLYTSPQYPSIGVAIDPAKYWYFNGKIDALSVWNRELTADEVTELYNSGNGKQYPN